MSHGPFKKFSFLTLRDSVQHRKQS